MRRRVSRAPIARPSSHPSPELGLRRPRSSLTDVVLPAPFGPRNPKTSPRGTVIVSPASATVRPNRFDRLTVWMAGDPAAAAPGGAVAFDSSFTSAPSAGYNACSGQMVSDVDGVVLLDRADDSVDDAVLDPDHSSAHAGVVTGSQSLHALHVDGGRGAELNRDGNRQRCAGIADRLDRRRQLWGQTR